MSRARACGVAPEKIWVDPGIGFGKSFGHNLFLLRHLGELRLLGCPRLVGVSRKGFLGPYSAGRPPAGRVWASIGGAAALMARGGAEILRVHDVSETREALAVAHAIRSAREGGELWEPRGGPKLRD